MEKHISIFLVLFLSLFFSINNTLFSQSAYQNSFAQVMSLDTCGVIKVTKTVGFEIGDEAILIQMKGAVVNEQDNAAFGSITNLGSAGLYEIITIDTIIGNSILTKFKPLNMYNINGLVQLVSFKKNINFTINQDINAVNWNGREGGIIAINAENLTIAANINADGAGFRGGTALSPSNSCNGFTSSTSYYYKYNDWEGALKGEGIAEFIANKEFGRGALANGGGGGNNHNAGGGGGGLWTPGGKGGNNEESGFLNCKGRSPGEGGKPIIAPSNSNRLFLGGGGGSGHANNNANSAGGNGGGIIILKANTIVYNKGILSSNGKSAAISIGDGAGGGGAAGTILCFANNLISYIPVLLNGGDGGDVTNSGARCFGPGGGGSGGIIIGKTPNFLITENGGAKGESTNGICTGDLSNGATNGSNGNELTIPNFQFPTSMNSVDLKIPFLSSTSTDTICRGSKALFTISVQATNTPLTYQWYVNRGTGFVPISDDTSYIGTKKVNLQIVKYNDSYQNYIYRCVITASCGSTQKSSNVEPFGFKLIDSPLASFSTIVNGKTIDFKNNSTNATSYLWKFGDGNTSSALNPSHTFNVNNSTVQLIVFGRCGNDTFTKSFSFVAAPIPTILNNPVQGCTPTIVNYQGAASANVDTWSWNFAGGNPLTSTDQNPTVIYFQPGVYGVELTTTNTAGMNKIVKTNFVTVNASIVPDFNIILVGKTITLDNKTIGADQYIWNFGDGNTSTDKNPVHTYAKSGDYNVTLLINKAGCSSSITKAIIIRISDTESILENRINIFPNPFENYFSIIMENIDAIYSLKIYNLLGQLMFNQEINQKNIKIDGNILTNKGMYIIEITLKSDKNIIYYKKLTKI
jgi:PKD repeat protein